MTKKWNEYTPKQYFLAGVSFVKKIFAQLVGCAFYKPRYLKGKAFSAYQYSAGWRWVMENVFVQKIIGVQRHIPYPVISSTQVMNWENIHFDVDDIGMFQRPGSYFQAATDAHIYIGKGTYIAGNVGLITANHDVYDVDKTAPGKDIHIGKHCWIGMNVVIMPGISLGDHTIVGAGSIVTKSVPDGYCVIAGNPAKVIRKLEASQCKENITESRAENEI